MFFYKPNLDKINLFFVIIQKKTGKNKNIDKILRKMLSKIIESKLYLENFIIIYKILIGDLI